MSEGESIRVAMFHPMLSYYRIDLFNELNSRLGDGLVLYSVPPSDRSGLGGAEERLTVEVRRSRTYRLGPAWLVPSALAVPWARRWDALVLSWNVRQLEILPVLLVARLLRVPVVLWGHGMGRSGSRIQRGVRSLQARLAAGVITYSERGAMEVVAEVPTARTHVVNNTPGRPAPEPGDVLDEVNHRLAYVGRLVPRKRIDLLVEAVALLRERGLDLVVDVVGDGPGRESLMQLVQERSMEDRVYWHGRMTEWAEVRAVVAGCDLVVQPAAAGLAVIDAFAAGRGAVVADGEVNNGPEADLVVDRKTGIRYSPTTPEALADRLAELYSDEEGLIAISRRAIDCYREGYTVDIAAEAFRDALVRFTTGPGSADR